MTRRNGRHNTRGPRANASGLVTHQPDGRQFGGQDRTFGPGLSAGQAGVQTLGGAGKRGRMAVQTYGSLGYASMGDGSMDMAIRGASGRTFAETSNEEGRVFSGLFCPKGHYLHCHGPFDCHCIKGVRLSAWWAKRPSPLLPDVGSTPAIGSVVSRRPTSRGRSRKRRRSLLRGGRR